MYDKHYSRDFIGSTIMVYEQFYLRLLMFSNMYIIFCFRVVNEHNIRPFLLARKPVKST